ncbi:hypothetical protein CTI12_AA022800 [Artemisia annua]|uniref:Uncharacterized protein n=1 Tax=Artemisia annua TaxID=35608 RepID=A0A2U1Q2X4_ARTAN|nr:hypothetical protein CTI12_AA022800 [Artemisia annua]
MVHNEMLQNNLLVADALHNLEKQCAHTSDHIALKDVMEESRSNATKESMNEDNPLLDMFGYIVLTTSAGIMDHEEARRKNVGGKVLGNA